MFSGLIILLVQVTLHLYDTIDHTECRSPCIILRINPGSQYDVEPSVASRCVASLRQFVNIIFADVRS